MVVSIAAVVLAVAGTSVAGVATISVLSKKEKKQTRGIAQQEIAKAAPGLAVGSAQNATTAGNADKLDGSDSGDFAKTLATTVDLPDENPETDLLTLPGFGLLKALAGACETEGGNEGFTLRYRNTLSTSVDSLTQNSSSAVGVSVGSTAVAPGGEISNGIGGTTVLIVQRIRPQSSAGSAATVTTFSRNVGASCRVSIQAVLTG
jgi:hypothetical protein